MKNTPRSSQLPHLWIFDMRAEGNHNASAVGGANASTAAVTARISASAANWLARAMGPVDVMSVFQMVDVLIVVLVFTAALA